jgi:hypothetical protein
VRKTGMRERERFMTLQSEYHGSTSVRSVADDGRIALDASALVDIRRRHREALAEDAELRLDPRARARARAPLCSGGSGGGGGGGFAAPLLLGEHLGAGGGEPQALVRVVRDDGAGLDGVVREVERARGRAGGVAHEHVRGRERRAVAGGWMAGLEWIFGDAYSMRTHECSPVPSIGAHVWKMFMVGHG